MTSAVLPMMMLLSAYKPTPNKLIGHVDPVVHAMGQSQKAAADHVGNLLAEENPGKDVEVIGIGPVGALETGPCLRNFLLEPKPAQWKLAANVQNPNSGEVTTHMFIVESAARRSDGTVPGATIVKRAKLDSALLPPDMR